MLAEDEENQIRELMERIVWNIYITQIEREGFQELNILISV